LPASGPGLQLVTGRVTLDGEPVEGAKVIFIPSRLRNDEGFIEPVSTGLTDVDGRFSLTTSDGKRGATSGLHRVLVSKSAAGSGTDSADSAPLRREPSLLATPAGTVPGNSKSGSLELALGSPGEIIPAHYNSDSRLTFHVRTNQPTVANFELTSTDPWIDP
jgi:hypothetical protein